ncbi:MAG TPA: hypothetical protein VIS76_09035 [Pseudomonadales bacterium]
MRILILHDAVPPDAAPETTDTLLQALTIERTLRKMGADAYRLPVSGDISALARQLSITRPQVVFNLVEAIAGIDGAAIAIPALLDGLGIAYTGSNAAAQALANDKCMAKALMRREHLPTPHWLPGPEPFHPGTYLIKTRYEHGSCGIDDDAVAEHHSEASLTRAIRARQSMLGRPCFAEEFIDGREFNLAVLDTPDGLRVLPPAEIDFSGFRPGKPKIVGYRAKWIADSFEYRATPRCFPVLEAFLGRELEALSLRAFRCFGLSGYGRVDFRVDNEGQPHILEVNPNPCLSPDAGFAAALERAGLSFEDALECLLSTATCSA